MAQALDATLLEDMTLLADPVRCRLLLLLEGHELTVGQLCSIVQLPQSTVSRHLKALADRVWIASRAEGTQRPYRATLDALDDSARQLWDLARQQMQRTHAAEVDRSRLAAVLARHRSRSQQFFANEGESWDALRAEQFGSTFHLQALVGLLDPDSVFADLGCGTGPLCDVVAPCVGRVVGVDDSATMLRLARERLQAYPHVDLRQGQLEELPIDTATLDVATLMLVLHHLQEPQRALQEAARCLKPGGRLLVVDMLPHDRLHYRQQMGHVWLGFAADRLRAWVESAGFTRVRLRALPPDPEVRGPNLFALVATRNEGDRSRESRTRSRGGAGTTRRGMT